MKKKQKKSLLSLSMEPIKLFTTISFCLFLVACNNEKDVKKDGIEIKEVIMTHVGEEPEPPPPPGYPSKFKTLEEWLIHICDSEKPQQDSLTYEFGIYQFSDSTDKPINECLLYLVGNTTYNNSPNHSITKIKFQPAEAFFKLPKEDCEHLTLAQIQTSIIEQLKKFISTEKFKSSFFQTAKEITVNGRRIWPE